MIAGDSAGGGLMVATLLALREARVPLPAGGVCISPWGISPAAGPATGEGRGRSDRAPRRVEEMARRISARRPGTPLASPLFGDLRGLPPLLIHVGSDEVLTDDASARRAGAAAGVDTTLEVYDRMVHAWHWFLPMLDEAQTAVDRIGAFVRMRAGATVPAR